MKRDGQEEGCRARKGKHDARSSSRRDASDEGTHNQYRANLNRLGSLTLPIVWDMVGTDVTAASARFAASSAIENYKVGVLEDIGT